MKRYVAEPGTAAVGEAMDAASRRVTSRISYVETVRAIARTAGAGGGGAAMRHFEREWPLLDVVEVDDRLAHSAARLAVEEELRTLDALHLASACRLPADDLVVATWDTRLAAAARRRGLSLLAES